MEIKIRNLKAKEVLDSRANPTVEVELETDKGLFRASVPSGASKGKYEAKALKASEAVENVNKVIGPQLIGKDATEQEKIDKLMIKLDGTKDKSKLGANAILPVSIAVCRAGAAGENLSLYQYIAKKFKFRVSIPLPCFNIIEGGVHAKNDLDIQEFMIVPQEKSFSENLQAGKEIYRNLREILKKEFDKIRVGDEGGFAPPISKAQEALDFLVQSTKDYKAKIGLDCAASQLYRYKKYYLEGEVFISGTLIAFYQDLIKKYPIIFIEDPFSEEDWKSWKILKNVLLIGDDLTVTNKERLRRAIKEKCINGIIVKPNQVGTITETLETVKIAKEAGLKIIVSHRSGETMDDFIADLAVAIGADFIKSGAPIPKERMVKYNRLLKIEQDLLQNNLSL